MGSFGLVEVNHDADQPYSRYQRRQVRKTVCVLPDFTSNNQVTVGPFRAQEQGLANSRKSLSVNMVAGGGFEPPTFGL
jgi:hypothetical protein